MIDPALLDILSVRELRLIRRLVRDQLTAREIAILARVSYGTIRSMRREIYRKLDVHGQNELVRWAVEHGVVTLEELVL